MLPIKAHYNNLQTGEYSLDDHEFSLEEIRSLIRSLRNSPNSLFVNELSCGVNLWFHGCEDERVWIEFYLDHSLTNAFVVPEVAEQIFMRTISMQVLTEPVVAFADLIDWEDPYPL